MPTKYRAPIIISSHAIKRWRERVGNEKVTKIQAALRCAIRSAIKSGMDVRNGASVINVTEDVRAVVSPSLQGGWEIITIIRDSDPELVFTENAAGNELRSEAAEE
ncbi:hypothetical protein [Paenibacillus naphthalenovorans]|uniref:hypothetical protein n=1 Tax=Paenibacillus naphthalenovorans TaxID=162209 RepID=UPI003D2CBAE7